MCTAAESALTYVNLEAHECIHEYLFMIQKVRSPLLPWRRAENVKRQRVWGA